LSARQARSAPLVAAFGDWLQAQRRKISAKSRLGKKLNYIHNHWNGLQTFLTDGCVEIVNNRVGNPIHPTTMTREKHPFRRSRCGWHRLGPHRFADRNMQGQRH
tara:strand:- start:21871 stop:22182 length:312 start_codon:yes stop_codon:yes gene_type:complete